MAAAVAAAAVAAAVAVAVPAAGWRRRRRPPRPRAAARRPQPPACRSPPFRSRAAAPLPLGLKRARSASASPRRAGQVSRERGLQRRRRRRAGGRRRRRRGRARRLYGLPWRRRWAAGPAVAMAAPQPRRAPPPQERHSAAASHARVRGPAAASEPRVLPRTARRRAALPEAPRYLVVPTPGRAISRNGATRHLQIPLIRNQPPLAVARDPARDD